MVLELKAPEEPDWHALRPLLPTFLRLRPQLRVHRHLLEQPSSPAARHRADQRRRDVGQPAPAVLAVARAVRHRVDGRAPRRPRSRSAAYGVVLLMCGSRSPSCSGRSSRRRAANPCWRPRSAATARAAVAAALRGGIGLAFVEPVDLRCALRRGGADVADPRSPDRERTASQNKRGA